MVMFAVAACSIGPATGPRPSPRPTVTYYISPAGNDSASGTSPSTAWRTLQHASSAVLPPGTRVLLRGGEVFHGQLRLDFKDAGSAANPVTIGSYGPGEAVIADTSKPAVTVYDTGGVTIQDLRLTGPAAPANSNSGINLYSDLGAGHRPDHIVIRGVSATGFLDGISIGAAHPGAGFSDVQISQCALYGNTDAGLLTYGPKFDAHAPAYAHQNVRVDHVVAYGNRGNPLDKTTNSGNGIVLGSVRDGSITWSTAHDNGGRSTALQGPAGIWTYDSTEIDIAHSLSYHNKTANRIDGNGFDLDQNTSNSVLEDNLSYGNDGTGFLVFTALNNGAQRGNMVRNNISSDDARDGAVQYGSITLTGPLHYTAVYQNTAVISPAANGALPPVLRLGPAVRGISVRNNIFSTEAGPLVADKNALVTSEAVLQGNDYYTVLGPWRLIWGMTTYGSMSEWRAATSEETVGGTPTGSDVNPGFVDPVTGLNAHSAAEDASAGAGFVLKPGSALAGAGLDLSSLGLTPVPANYAGTPRSVRHPNVGAQ